MKSKYRKLDKIYAKLPEIECKGLCHPSCTIIPAEKIEIKRARERMGGKNPFCVPKELAITPSNELLIPSCPALKDKRCSIYNARPLVCRAYGVAEGLLCPFGCVPKKIISKVKVVEIMEDIRELQK